jgi:hypothetical protein
MLAEGLYFTSIALFGFAVLAATQVPDSNWLVASIFPVFIAGILGFVMWVYAWSEYSVVPVVVVVLVGRSLTTRNLFIAICASVVLGLICARFAFIAADLG